MEQAHFEARRARRQYEAVDPDHRLVAAELERLWNEALAAVAPLDEELTRRSTNDRPPLSPEQREQLLALGSDMERGSPSLTRPWKCNYGLTSAPKRGR